MNKPNWYSVSPRHGTASSMLMGYLNDEFSLVMDGSAGKLSADLRDLVQSRREELDYVQARGDKATPQEVYAASYRSANLLASLYGTSVGPADHFPYMIATYPSVFGRDDLGSDKPVWDGKQTGQGKTLLVHAVKMQGLGDIFQFAPLVNEARSQGGFDSVVFEVPKRMVPLFDGKNLADIVVAKGDPLPPHDMTLPMMNLSSVLYMNLHTRQVQAAYLAPTWKIGTPENDWINANIRQPQAEGRLVVGLAWQGDAGNFALEPARSMNLAQLHNLLALDNTQFVCLQNPMDVNKSPLQGQFAALSNAQRGRLTVLPEGFDKAVMFGDTMHAMRAMDMVVSTDTGTAHAAGAAGARLVVMGQHVPELRYPAAVSAELTDNAGDGRQRCLVQALPYYSNATLLQQRQPGDWASVAGALETKLSFRQAKDCPGVSGDLWPTRKNALFPTVG